MHRFYSLGFHNILTKSSMVQSLMAVGLMLSLTACQLMPTHTTASNTTSTTASMNTPKTVTLVSNYSFDDTTNRLINAFEDKGMTIFGVIDHQKAAQTANMTMQPARVVIFGTPKAGTPLMVKDPIFALQLPLKVLITQSDNQVLVAYEPAQSLIAGTNIPYDDVKNTLAKAEMLIKKTVTAD